MDGDVFVMSRFARLLIVSVITASLAAFAGGSASLGAVRRVALGVAMNDSRNPAVVEAFKASVGRYPAIWTMWSDWGASGGYADKAFPTEMASYLKGTATRPSIVPMIMWEPINPANQTDCANWSNQVDPERSQPRRGEPSLRIRQSLGACRQGPWRAHPPPLYA